MDTPLSVVVITHNEELRLEACLQSVAGLSDELIVVDSFSTDDTKNIALRHGAIVFEHAYKGQVEQKQFALTKTSHQHVLALDADEQLTEELIQSIAREKKQGFPAGVYEMNRITYYAGTWIKHGGWYPDWKLRLWNKSKAKWGGRNPHDQVFPKEIKEVKRLQGHLLHYGFETIAEHKQRITNYAEIGAEALYAEGKSSSILRGVLSALIKGIRDYIFRGGFRDGKSGWLIAWYSMKGKYLKYKKLYELNKRQ
ncbi:glycosyltransferase family 2 protein [Marinoscillum furvescens]|uniref:Glycosyltransferase involved in cell wall biosynthesis n=1 Tax=Marinoscillum furvescens DSM 4134 TaxID=1122208 RepID=A0A3D9L4C1_MARFU|nr:glycosyltransferase family 2 protein [Marinoscillum furvescens]RED99518.1 glycosyltransferase involved in cell wall biosynthesis [Marinoscillum furvescens DSM 4134]